MDEERARNLRLILTPPGKAWSGRARYAAATFFHAAGAMDEETLEIYRICCRLDGEDPCDVLRRWQVGAAWLDWLDDAARGLSSDEA